MAVLRTLCMLAKGRDFMADMRTMRSSSGIYCWLVLARDGKRY